ncbi:type III secretion system translocon subunit SctE [Pantoea endophytica]
MNISNQLSGIFATIAEQNELLTNGKAENIKVSPERVLVPPTGISHDGRAEKRNTGTAGAYAAVATQEDLDIEENNTEENVPVLRVPTKNVEKQSMYNIYNSLRSLMLNEDSKAVDKFQHSLELFSSSMEALNKRVKEMLDELSGQIDEAMAELDGAASELDNLTGQANTLKDKITNLQAKLDQLKEQGVPESAEEYQAVSAAIKDAEDGLLSLGTQLSAARQRVSQLSDKVLALQNKFNTELDAALAGHNNTAAAFLDMKHIQAKNEDQLSVGKRLIYLINKCQAFMAKDVSDRAEAERQAMELRSERMHAQQAARVKENEEQIRKAEESSKIKNCISKIIGFVVSAVSIALTVVSGGLASPLAAIVLGITLADMAATAITGQSFLAKALSPLMNHVIMPLMQAMGKIVDFLLEKTGLGKLLEKISPELYQTIKTGLTLAATIATVIAAAILLKSAATQIGKMIEPFTKAASEQISKMISQVANKIPEFMKNAGKSFKDLNSKLTVKNHDSLIRYTTTGNEALGFSGVTLKAVSDVQQGLANQRYEKFNAENDIYLFNNEVVEKIQDDMREAMKKIQEFMATLSQMATEIVHNEMNASNAIINNLKNMTKAG